MSYTVQGAGVTRVDKSGTAIEVTDVTFSKIEDKQAKK